MGKSRNKSRSEIESLRGEVRQLKKELKYYRKRAHIETIIIEDEEPIENVSTTKCPECGSKKTRIIDLKHVIIGTCEDCGYKKKLS